MHTKRRKKCLQIEGKCWPAMLRTAASSGKLQNSPVEVVQKAVQGPAEGGQKVRKTARNWSFLARFWPFFDTNLILLTRIRRGGFGLGFQIGRERKGNQAVLLRSSGFRVIDPALK
jgi:hypothetical protein